VFVRSEGTNEKLGDTVLSCTGGNALPMNITVYLSPAVSVTSGTVSGVSETIAGLGMTGQAFTPGSVSGVVSGSTVTFSNVPTTTGSFSLVITNIRVNATQVAPSGAPIAITETFFVSGPAVTPGILPSINSAFATPGLANVRATSVNSVPVC